MASTDARPIPIKNTAFRAVFPILDADGDLVTGAASLDSEVSKDQGAFADCTNEATEIATASGMYYLDLTSTEMNADCVAVIVKTGTAGAKTTVLVFYPEETGDINVDVTAYGGTAGTFSGGRPEVNTTHAAGTAWASGAITAAVIATGAIDADAIADNAIDAGAIAADAITAAKIADGAIDAATFAAGAINAAAIAADAITDAKVAADVTIASVTGAVGSVTGAVGSVTGNVGGNVTGTIGGFTAGAKAEIQTEAEEALVVHRLDELLNADSDIDGAAPPTVGSVIHEMLTKTAGSFTYDQTTDSLEAVRDRGDAAWTTATGFSTLDAAGVRTAVGLGSANLDTQLAAIDDFLDTEVAAILAAVDTETAAILADTNELQTDWVDGGRLDLILDARASQASVNTIDDFLDTEIAAIITTLGTPAGASISADLVTIDNFVDDIESRLTAALATKLAAHAAGVLVLVVDAGSTTTSVVFKTVEGAAASATNDFYNGRVIVFTSGALAGQATSISDYVGATKTATVVALTGAPAEDVTGVIV